MLRRSAETSISVLVIEDDPEEVLILKELLSEARASRFDVRRADRLEAGLEHLTDGAFEVILLDLGLPDSQGADTFLETYGHAPTVPIIVLTGLQDEDLGSRLVESGAQDYLVKGQLTTALLERSIRFSIERHRLTARLNHQLEQLKSAELRFRRIFEENGDGIVIVDAEGAVRFVNPAAEAVLARKAEDLVGEAFGFPLVPGNVTELDIRRPGPAAIVEMRVVEAEWDQDRAYLASLRDVTEQRHQQQALQRASRLASIGELAAGVAHEINNPLNNILGFAQLLLFRDLPQDVRDDVQKIYEDGQRAARVVQNMLSLAREREFDVRPVNLCEVVNRVLELKSYDLSTSQIEVCTQLPRDLPLVLGDNDQLVEVLLNIVSNAGEALVATQGSGHINIEGTSSGNTVRVSITDDGPGIPRDILDKVFEPFFTTREVGMGTGLGLSISYDIVRKYHGRLWAESIEGHGSVFHIELPSTKS